ncbi:hypothetical protein MBT84_24545 [Streptomyces sp. MBT84]|nr:hypothetical protein [Streptomyces sp. MBT84]
MWLIASRWVSCTDVRVYTAIVMLIWLCPGFLG